MKTGSGGTFVVSWSQTEVDGVLGAAPELLVVGAAWRWSGVPVRIDGAQGMLVLDGAEGAEEIRRRAARLVRRLVGAAIERRPGLLHDTSDPDEDPCHGFVLTDGQKTFDATLIDVAGTDTNLLMFVGELPPAERDLWVVRTTVSRRSAGPGPQAGQGGVICFTPGTRLLTPDGPRLIETLRPGDLVSTKDNGDQPIAWCGHRRMSGARLYAMPHLRPIRIRSNVFGLGQPDADLIVSPQHRMLVRGRAAQALFNADEVLVAAEDLLNDLSITVDHQLREVTYVHVLLERHQIVWANRLETESFHPSNAALDTIDPAQRESLMSLLPGLADDPLAYGEYARRNLSRSEAAILRHELAA